MNVWKWTRVSAKQRSLPLTIRPHLPSPVHCIYPAWFTASTQPGSPHLPSPVHRLYTAWFTTSTQPGSPHLPSPVHRY